MNVKLHITWQDLLKLLFGGQLLVCDRYNNSIVTVKQGDDTIITS